MENEGRTRKDVIDATRTTRMRQAILVSELGELSNSIQDKVIGLAELKKESTKA